MKSLNKFNMSKISKIMPKNGSLSSANSFFGVVGVSSDFRCDPVGFVGGLSGSYRKVLRYLFSYRGWSGVRIKNKTIARAVGVSVKSVTRATSYFMSRGILCKEQDDSPYSLNSYRLAPCIVRGTPGYKLWLSYLPECFARLFMTTGLLPNKRVEKPLSKPNVPLYISKENNSKLYNKPYKGCSRFYNKRRRGKEYSRFHSGRLLKNGDHSNGFLENGNEAGEKVLSTTERFRLLKREGEAVMPKTLLSLFEELKKTKELLERTENAEHSLFQEATIQFARNRIDGLLNDIQKLQDKRTARQDTQDQTRYNK